MTEPTMVIDFVARGLPGRVCVSYEINHDPDRWGYPLLELDFPAERSRGFPVIQAEVDYPAEGYGAILAWIQLVWICDRDGSEPEQLVFDRPPQLLGLELPYLSFGVRPVLFDAPSMDGIANADFVARSMLAFTPDCVMTRQVQPICGFSWGFELREAVPAALPLRTTTPADWEPDLALLREEFPSWRFGG
jgi:hypothetical protein